MFKRAIEKIEILEVQETGVKYREGMDQGFQKFKIFGNLSIDQKRMIEENPELLWELMEDVVMSLEQMYGDRADEVKQDMASRRIVKKDKNSNPLSNYNMYSA